MTGQIKVDTDTLRKLWHDGVPTVEIAERFGVRYPAINSAARRLGLTPRGRIIRPTNFEGLPANDLAGMSLPERRLARLERDAAQIFEDILHRKRWLARDRDALVKALARIIDRECREGGA